MRATTTLAAVLGTRPEIIKFATVLQALEADPRFSVITIVTGQQPDLAPAFLQAWSIKADHSLNVMVPDQAIAALVRRISSALAPIVRERAPQAILVQGDTASALAGALVGGFQRIPVVHIEAGLRTWDYSSPYPEEINRTLISHVAELHCAPTPGNVRNLIAEGINENAIVLTGNPIVDAVSQFAVTPQASPYLRAILERVGDTSIVLLTAHRRENFGPRLRAYFQVIRQFLMQYPATSLVFPVHPNPQVQQCAHEIFDGTPRAYLIEPLGYTDFLFVLKQAKLVLSDSGGIQEEIATLGKPLVILRDKTERPEIFTTGLAQMAADPAALDDVLSKIVQTRQWPASSAPAQNPFGDGHSGARIAHALTRFLPQR